MSAGKIQRLPELLISQIAAGEVIERPASVVKELVENAVDAGARRIEVTLEEGGLGAIEVRDDGSGMSSEDAALAVERHATSKLNGPEDLFNIRTLGFRGEALPSIASVSRFELCTRSQASDAGVRLVIAGGDARPPEVISAPIGTRVSVRDLFFNQPARRKFQKTPATEQQHAVQAVLRIALGCPGVHFSVKGKTRVLLDVPAAAADVALGAERVAAALGHALAPRLYPFSLRQDRVAVSGFAADPEQQSGDAQRMFSYVNGRFVRDRVLQRAILEGYRTLLPHGRYPTIVLWVEIPPEDVDVNVHPQKFEVRFKDGQRVFGVVVRAIAEILAKTPWLDRGGARVYTLKASPETAAEDGRAANVLQALARANRPATFAPVVHLGARAGASALPLASAADDVSPRPEIDRGAWGDANAEAALASDGPGLLDGGFFSRLKVLGQFSRLYILCEGPGDELVIVDQHAAHERVTFERLLNAFESGRVPEQRLLFPLTLSLRREHLDLVEEHAEALARLGLEMRAFGEDTVALTSVPAMVSDAKAKAYALDAIAELADASRRAEREFAHAVLARVACHAAVRSGDLLSQTEMEALLKTLDEVDCSVRCPHGRPVVARVRRETIGRWFERG